MVNPAIQTIILDDTVLALKPAAKHERDVAIADLIASNSFGLADGDLPPYKLTISLSESRLMLDVEALQTQKTVRVPLPLKPLRAIIKDYFLICESYTKALEAADPRKIEAIDMGRRGMHNEGSEVLKDLLEPRVSMDFETARRLFTLICALHTN